MILGAFDFGDPFNTVGALKHENGYLRNNDDFPSCGVAPIYLPDGVTVTKTQAAIFDTVTDHNPILTIVFYNYLDSQTPKQISAILGSDDSNPIQLLEDTTILHATVDLSQNAYYAKACFKRDVGAAQRLYAMIVHYE